MVNVNQTIGEVCPSSTLTRPDCFPTTMYNVSIYDVTGYRVYSETDITDKECITTTILQPSNSVCGPFVIAVEARNPFVRYPSSPTFKNVGIEGT